MSYTTCKSARQHGPNRTTQAGISNSFRLSFPVRVNPALCRAPCGISVHETTPEGNWKILTIKGAMSLRGMIATMTLDTMTIEAATDAEISLTVLDYVLCPFLRSGNVVVMDNLGSHKVAGVRERIAPAGAELLYLPPYLPDLNPIEKACAKLKQLLCTARARSAKALEQAIAKLLSDISPQDSQAWFRTPFRAL